MLKHVTSCRDSQRSYVKPSSDSVDSKNAELSQEYLEAVKKLLAELTKENKKLKERVSLSNRKVECLQQEKECLQQENGQLKETVKNLNVKVINLRVAKDL